MAEPRIGSAIVFGATSAIAQAVVRRLAESHAALFLVGRDAARLEAVAADARVRGAGAVATAVADLDVTAGFPSLIDRAFEALGRVELVLLAHGVLATSDACEADPAVAAHVLESDFTAPALLAQAVALRLAAAQGSGTLAVIGSVAGDRGRQSIYAYGAAKGGLAIFLAGLRNRMHPRGVRVVTVKPGFVDTPMTAGLPKNALFASPDRVARDVLRAVRTGRDEIYTPGFWRLVMAVIRA
ncbi:MAG TPA: SDR family NAD(P)-dependent oxidoreductase, partial [Anaeromyxobacteraceae bacterium]|nr:SDR family NAD(P)-dependent oxidoreductase [Anaeromyxobacteraceae bacterium]